LLPSRSQNPMQPWSIMGYYPSPPGAEHPTTGFFGHVPHFLLWLCVVFVMGACGGAIANACDARPTRQYLGVLAGSATGIVVASLIFLGRG